MKKLIVGVLVLMCAVWAVACVPKEPAEARARLKSAGYIVEVYQKDYDIDNALFLFGVDTNGVAAVVLGEAKSNKIEDKFDFAVVVYCLDRKAAKYVQNDFDVFVEQEFARILELDGGITADEFCVVKKGKIVIFGRKKAVECLT